MDNKRIQYIDKIKGFAILLVVMGHLLDKSLLIEENILNRLIYSTHMPIFMYLSGFFALKNTDVTYTLISFLKKKAIRLIIPYLTIGVIYGLLKSDSLSISQIYNNMGGYWFFPALFLCMFFVYILKFITSKLNKKDILGIDLFVSILLWCVLIFSYYLDVVKNIPYFLHFIKMFPFFIFGYLTQKYKNINELIYSNSIFAISLFLYILLIMFPLNININLCGFFAIIIVLNTFKIYNHSIPNIFSSLGQNSLEIYSLHWFILPNLIMFKRFFLNETNVIILDNNNLLLVLVFITILSIVIAFSSVLISKIFKINRFFSFIFFGIYYK